MTGQTTQPFTRKRIVFPPVPRPAKWIAVTCGAGFCLWILILILRSSDPGSAQNAAAGFLNDWLGANPGTFWTGRIWQPLTSVFIHTGLGHLIANILFLMLTAHPVVTALGESRFLVLFLVHAVGIHLLYVIAFHSSPVILWGSTAGVNAVLGFFAVSSGYASIRFMGLIPVSGKTLAVIFLAANTACAAGGLGNRLFPLVYIIPFLTGYGYAHRLEKRMFSGITGGSRKKRNSGSGRFQNIDLRR
ncbi:rhomboid family intramembrane serine protease [bacterium]|nr:rhomboid family intramembrane serine protease [candidate division CSSED10-310 bacterium]